MPEKQTAMNRRLFLVVSGIITVFCLVVFLGVSVGTDLLFPRPTPPPSPFSFEELVATIVKYGNDVNTQRYIGNLYGAQVHWKGWFSSVESDGAMDLSLSPFMFGTNFVRLHGVPPATAQTLTSGKEVRYTGIVESADFVRGIKINVRWTAFDP